MGNRPPSTPLRLVASRRPARLLLLITIAVTVVSLVALAVALLSSGKSPLTRR